MNIFKPYRFISPLEIEGKALHILQQMEKNPHFKPKMPLDASRVAEFLGLDVVWDSIEADAQGKIAARILPLEKLIEINEDIRELKEGYGESTIAHEVGHWVLHINQDEVNRTLRIMHKGINIKVPPLLCRSEEQLEGIEWQAQYFASCLLMPQFLLIDRVKNVDLTQWKNLYDIGEYFGVTISNLTHRLKSLGWIDIDQQTRQITYRKSLPTSVKSLAKV
jgi:Zn-dependent peptidase ImmA (M78 family)